MANVDLLQPASAAHAIVVISAALCSEPGGRPPIVLIDGRSGAGKSTLATAVRLHTPSANIIRLDDIYPGWHGLEAAREHLSRHVLQPLAQGRPARWQRWNWQTDVAAEWTTVDATAPLIVEGVGALSAASRACAQLGVWVELAAKTRKERALSRDGDTFAPHWDQWALHEDDFIAREHPRDHADMIVDGRSIAG